MKDEPWCEFSDGSGESGVEPLSPSIDAESGKGTETGSDEKVIGTDGSTGFGVIAGVSSGGVEAS